jgi:carbamoyl-phosphate synthase large subunit
MKYKILITSINGPLGYELVKHLKKRFYVVGCDSQPHGLASYICDEFYICPHGSKKEFLTFLKKICTKVDQIFLYADEEILNLSKSRHKLKSVYSKVLISNQKTITLCNNKLKLKKYLKNYINLPKSSGRKIIIKPIVGRGSKNQIILDNNKNKFLKNIERKTDFFVEEFIEGKEFTIDCIFDYDNKLIYALARERIIKSNLSVVGKITKYKAIDIFLLKLSDKIKFIGNVNIQVIVDKKGKIFLTDINPRISGSIIFSIKAGFNPFVYAQKILKNENLIRPKKIKYEKTYYRYWKTYN